MKAYAEYNTIPFTEEKPKNRQIEELKQRGVTLFLSAGYAHKIPYTQSAGTFGINIHPTLLPRARGIMPLPFIIAYEPEAAGFTAHKLINDIDAGDILLSCPIKIDNTTDIETLSAQIALKCPEEISKLVNNIAEFWENATAQNHNLATLYPEPKGDFRALIWSESLDQQLIKSRAFGRFGVLAEIKNRFGQRQKLAVYNFSGWHENHTHMAGTLLRSSTREIIIAVPGGFLCLKEFRPL